jgi:hypothetical protein
MSDYLRVTKKPVRFKTLQMLGSNCIKTVAYKCCTVSAKLAVQCTYVLDTYLAFNTFTIADTAAIVAAIATSAAIGVAITTTAAVGVAIAVTAAAVITTTMVVIVAAVAAATL